jgi:hypothetical protein
MKPLPKSCRPQANPEHLRKLALLLKLNRAGLVIFPLFGITKDKKTNEPVCKCRNPKCPSPGKHPRIKWTRLSGPLPDSDIKYYFWEDPDSGWGCHLGLSKLVVLDVDPRNGGLESLSQWETLHGKLPPTLVAESGSGGRHYYFCAPAESSTWKSKIDLLPGLELLSGKHIVVLPPSPHKCGGSYRWLSEGLVTVYDTPQTILDAVRVLEAEKMAGVACVKDEAAAAQGAQSVTSSVLYCPPHHSTGGKVFERARKYLQRVAPAIQGQQGNRATCRVACILIIDFNLFTDEAMILLREFNTRCVPPWTEAELQRIVDWANKLPGPRGGKLGYQSNAIDAELAGLGFDASELEFEIVLPGQKTLNDQLAEVFPEPAPTFKIDPPKPVQDVALAQQIDEKLEALREKEREKTAREIARLERHAGCKRPIKLLLGNSEQIRILYKPCRSWSCKDDCRPRILEQSWQITFDFRAGEVAKEKRPLYAGLIVDTRKDWGRVRRQIFRQNGDYFCILDTTIGKRWIVSDAPFTVETIKEVSFIENGRKVQRKRSILSQEITLEKARQGFLQYLTDPDLHNHVTSSRSPRPNSRILTSDKIVKPSRRGWNIPRPKYENDFMLISELKDRDGRAVSHTDLKRRLEHLAEKSEFELEEIELRQRNLVTPKTYDDLAKWDPIPGDPQTAGYKLKFPEAKPIYNSIGELSFAAGDWAIGLGLNRDHPVFQLIKAQLLGEYEDLFPHGFDVRKGDPLAEYASDVRDPREFDLADIGFDGS